jgi:hypothetical protein
MAATDYEIISVGSGRYNVIKKDTGAVVFRNTDLDSANTYVAYSGTPSGSSSGGSNMSSATFGTGYQWEYLTYLIATAAGDLAYKQRKLDLVDVPMVEIEKERLANQARNDAFNRMLSQSQTTGYMHSGLDPAGAENARKMAYEYLATDPTGMHGGADWQNSNFDQRRDMIEHWMKNTDNRDVIGAARDPIKLAQAQGWNPGSDVLGKTLQREMFEEGMKFDREKYYGDMLSSLSGPRDWQKYQTARRAIGGAGNLVSPVAAAMRGGKTMGQIGTRDAPVDTWGDQFKKWMLG